jgi:hypothetical protein
MEGKMMVYFDSIWDDFVSHFLTTDKDIPYYCHSFLYL